MEGADVSAVWLRSSLDSLPGPDLDAGDATRARASDILRPAGALARLDEVAAWAAEWQGSHRPAVRRPAALVFAADHGVTAAGVSRYPADVTAAMLTAYRAGRSTISAFAAVAGAQVSAIDVGVGRPTGDIRYEPAMSPERFEEAVAAGRGAVEALDADILVLGEMGIGNTTAAAALACLLAGLPTDEAAGLGTGLDDEGRRRKRAVLDEAVARHTDAVTAAGGARALEALRRVGGLEIAALAGAMVTAAQRGVPVLVDGFIVSSAALVAERYHPGVRPWLLFSHRSAERGHRDLLAALGATPLLDLDLRLGEGTGAALALPLVRAACALHGQMATFAEAAVSGPRP